MTASREEVYSALMGLSDHISLLKYVASLTKITEFEDMTRDRWRLLQEVADIQIMIYDSFQESVKRVPDLIEDDDILEAYEKVRNKQ